MAALNRAPPPRRSGGSWPPSHPEPRSGWTGPPPASSDPGRRLPSATSSTAREGSGPPHQVEPLHLAGATGILLFGVESSPRLIERPDVLVPPISSQSRIALPVDAGEGIAVRGRRRRDDLPNDLGERSGTERDPVEDTAEASSWTARPYPLPSRRPRHPSGPGGVAAMNSEHGLSWP